MKLFTNIRQRGFTLLLAALIASLVLSLASAIFDIAQKQVVLSSLSQQSQYAFYAADTAVECALYWDIRYNYFAQTTPVLTSPPLPSPPSVTCDGQSIALTSALSSQSYPYALCPTGTTGSYCVSNATIPVINLFSQQYCAQISVEKCQGTIDHTSGVCTPVANASISTQIRANGFNVPCAVLGTSPAALERSVELNY